jgi:hypothetical protein
MGLQEEISDYNLGERTKLEKIISTFVKSKLGKTIKNDNFYDVVVDIFNSHYGKHCHVTFLMKKPFGGEYSNDVHTIFRRIKPQMGDFFPSFQGGISNSTETLNSYLRGKYWYDEKKKSLNENKTMENPNELTEPQLKVFNKVLNKKLSQNFPWWFEGIEISRAGFNGGQSYLYMDGNIYVDADWIGEQWRKYNDYKPLPEFGTGYDEYGFGDLIGINDGWLDNLKETFISVFNSIDGGKYPKYLSFSWLNVKPVETKKEMKENNFLKEHIREVIREEVNRRYLKPNEKSEKFILDKLNAMASGTEIYHVESYKTRHDFEFCKNGKQIMNFALFFEETDDNTPTSERQFETSTLSVKEDFVGGLLGAFPVRRNYLYYIIEEWFEDNFLSKISDMIGRNDISVEELSFNERSYVCVPPIKEVPEGVTQDEMIKVIGNGTLWFKRDLLALEEREPGSLEFMYLQKLRNNEINRLDGGN